jgi:hypothetical protein
MNIQNLTDSHLQNLQPTLPDSTKDVITPSNSEPATAAAQESAPTTYHNLQNLDPNGTYEYSQDS